MPKTSSNSKIILDIEKKASELRQLVIDMLLNAKSGHSAGSLGTADIFAALYFHVLNVNPKKPNMPLRDRFILSNGHICPIWYATLYKKGYFPKQELWNFRKIDANLQGHPHYKSLPGIENTGGPLGQGFSVAAGIALAAKMDKKLFRVYCMTGDGELNEGQIWETAMFAPNHNLNNLTWIIDRNNIQIDGYTEKVMSLENLRDKLEAFNWFVIEVDGHNIEEIINACEMAKAVTQRPTAIIAHTIPGKGVSFMEYKFEWHGKPPNTREAKKALTQLRTMKGKIKHG
ncbi:transketolase [Patescibacteria group bacterium]